MTQLLVSVRSAAEAQLALECGVAWIDVKEPSLGSLGSASGAELRAVADCVGDQACLSAALGELGELPQSPQFDTSGYRFAKLGLSKCQDVPDWQVRWQQAAENFATETAAVAVIYADWQTAAAPSPEEVYELLEHPACGALLVDTWDKRRGSLLQLWSQAQLAEMISAARHRNKLAVVAGSLSLEDIPQLLPLDPDVVAVRGAATNGDRRGKLDPRRVQQLVELVDQAGQPKK